MDPVLHLSFSEWTVINEFEKHFSKKEGYTVSIPSSRQQKGFDILLYNNFSKKSLTIQVKGSRTYTSDAPEKKIKVHHKYFTWFNAFDAKKGFSDYYVLFGLYIKSPGNDSKATQLTRQNWYDFMLLLFTEDEMLDFLSKLVQKTSDKKDTKFGFSFDTIKKIFLTRGAKTPTEITGKLFTERLVKIKSLLNPENKKYETKKRQPKT